MGNSELLKKGLNAIQKRGWWNGRKKANGSECMWTAISGYLITNETLSLLVKAIGYRGKSNDNYNIITTWNDKKGRTKRQVIAAYKRAIKLAEAETA